MSAGCGVILGSKSVGRSTPRTQPTFAYTRLPHARCQGARRSADRTSPPKCWCMPGTLPPHGWQVGWTSDGAIASRSAWSRIRTRRRSSRPWGRAFGARLGGRRQTCLRQTALECATPRACATAPTNSPSVTRMAQSAVMGSRPTGSFPAPFQPEQQDHPSAITWIGPLRPFGPFATRNTFDDP